MPTSLVITVVGPDRPGLVESLSRVINEHGGNWTRSRMAHLAGQFAGMLHVTLPGAQADVLKTALESLAGDSLQVVIARDDSGPDTPASPASLPLTLELVGQDRTGIVREISHILSEHGINVEELATECESAPMSGEMLFRAQATLSAPPGADLDALRTDLEAIAHDLMVELHLDRP